MQTLPVDGAGLQHVVVATQTASGPQSSLVMHSAPHSSAFCAQQIPPPSAVVPQKHEPDGSPRREQSVQPPGQQASAPAQAGSGLVVWAQTRRPPPGGGWHTPEQQLRAPSGGPCGTARRRACSRSGWHRRRPHRAHRAPRRAAPAGPVGCRRRRGFGSGHRTRKGRLPVRRLQWGDGRYERPVTRFSASQNISQAASVHLPRAGERGDSHPAGPRVCGTMHSRVPAMGRASNQSPPRPSSTPARSAASSRSL